MKRIPIIILIFLSASLYFMACNTVTPKTIAQVDHTIINIQHQLDNPALQIQKGDSKEVIAEKQVLIKSLKDAQDEIIKLQQQNAKISEQKEALEKYAGIGKIAWAILGVIGLAIIAFIISKFVK